MHDHAQDLKGNSAFMFHREMRPLLLLEKIPRALAPSGFHSSRLLAARNRVYFFHARPNMKPVLLAECHLRHAFGSRFF